MITQQDKDLMACIPIDQFGREVPTVRYIRRCSKHIPLFLQRSKELSESLVLYDSIEMGIAREWHGKISASENVRPSVKEEVSRVEILNIAKASRKSVLEFLNTIEAKVLYATGVTSLITGIILLMLSKGDLAIIMGTPFIIIFFLLLPLYVGLWQTKKLEEK